MPCTETLIIELKTCHDIIYPIDITIIWKGRIEALSPIDRNRWQYAFFSNKPCETEFLHSSRTRLEAWR